MTDLQYGSTFPVEVIDHMGSDETVIRAAKVSTMTDTVAATDPERFIRFLAANRHMSPFEHCTVTLRIDAPIFVWREFQRHRTLSFNEASGRYTEMRPLFYVPAEHRPLIQVGKAGSYTFEAADHGTVDAARESISHASLAAYDCYRSLLDKGVAKEVARMVLPVNIYSTAYVTGKVRNWLQFLSLRTEATEQTMFPSYPQWEIARLADTIELELRGLFPVTMKVWHEEGRVGL